MWVALFSGVGIVVGIFIGTRLRDLQDQISDLRKRLNDIDNTPAPGVAMGSYDKVDEYNAVNTDSAVGIVEVKTPQLLSWEEQQRQQKEIERV